MQPEQKQKLLVMNSQLIGVLAAAAGGGNAADLQTGSWAAQNGTQYNRQLHYEEQQWLKENAKVFAQKEGITEQVAMERLSQQALKNTDYLWRALLSDGDDSAALAFLSGAGKTFVNDLGEKQVLFTASGQQLFRPEMFADTADPTFYKNFVQSGVSRDLSSGLTKELKDSGIAIKDGAINLYDAVRENPKAVMGGLWEGVKGLPQSVIDSFHESGNAIGEGAAVALDSELTAKLNAIYGVDVSTAQQALLFIRTASAITMAGTGAKVGGKLTGATAEAVGKKLDEILVEATEKELVKGGGTKATGTITERERLVYLSNSTAPGIRDRLSSAVSDIRTGLPREGNVAFAEVDVGTLSSETMVMKAYSQFDNRVEEFLPKPDGDLNSWILKPQVATSKYVGTPEGYLRDMDTEFKILETLAQRLGPSSQTSGRINLISEKMVCPSCSDIVTQFRERYPNIQLNVFTVEK
ncbi:deaminase domain-containing protein [Pseudomonas sp. H3_H05]